MKKLFTFKTNDINLLKRAIKYIKPYLKKFIIASLFIILGIALDLIQPLIWGIFLKNIFNNNMDQVINNLIYLGAISIFQILFYYLQQYNFTYINNNIIYDIKADMFKKVLELPIKAFDEIRVGEFMSRIHSDAYIISNVLTNQLLNIIIDLIKIIIIIILVIKINIYMSFIIILAIPISYLILTKFGRLLRRKNNELAKLNDTYFSNMHQSILGIREIKNLGITNYVNEKFLQIASKINKKSINLSNINYISYTLFQTINIFSNFIIMGIGSYLIFIKILAIQYFIAFIQYTEQFYMSLKNLTNINTNIQQTLTSFERIFGLLDNLNYAPENFGNKNINNINGLIEFNHVFFEYINNMPVLIDISFIIKPNSKIAIVGSSGSGKTTLLNLLLKFYNTTSGEIKIDNYNINEFSEDSLKSHIAIVRQEPFLFNLSIKENLLLANPFATDDDIIMACKKAYIHDFIISLPKKYDTILNENSINLSGGQKQRIAIARVIIKKSKIILFDEATSSLDNESQSFIKKAIDELAKNHTVIIIAHRLYTIIDADEIIIFDKGKIVGQDNHNNLINSNAIYKHLYETELNAIKSSV